ncbi:uncharacterized protein LOC127286881 [Leptopilina boulardi]|uniref:uncharacterized protein LOC127286881 n=1 Tax=Leptopilina boulardi TaxID=63433 RepID=UPI0021F5F983|nr:uncharacterized protein LOC127286881 [Leptopilina boulardi]
MNKVDSFIAILKEKNKLKKEKYELEENDNDKEKTKMINDVVETTENLIQTKENIAKNLNFLISNKHSIYKVTQEVETTKGLPISSEYQQQALDLITNSITFLNNVQDTQRILETDKNLELSKPASDIVRSTRTIENELKKLRSSYNQIEALQLKVEQLKSTLFIPESETQQDLEDSLYINT